MRAKKIILYSAGSFIFFILFLTTLQLPVLLNSSAKSPVLIDTNQEAVQKRNLIKKHLSNRIVLKLRNTLKKSPELQLADPTVKDMFGRIGASNVSTINIGPQNGSTYVRITIPKNSDIKKTIAILKQNSSVELAEPDHVFSISTHSKDPYYIDPNPPAAIRNLSAGNGKWDPSSFDIQWNLREISVPHNLPTNNPAIKLAVIDSGVDYTHPELSDHIWKNPGEIEGNGIDDDKNGYIDDIRGWDAATFDFIPEGETDPKFRFVKLQDNDPMDDPRENFFSYYYSPTAVSGGHGTHVAGTAASSNNGYGGIGVHPGVTIMSLRAMNAAGYGYNSDIAQMISYAVSNGAKVINLSLGGPENTTVMSDAVKYAERMGVVVVAAVPNGEGFTPVYSNFPSDYDTVIAVAATDHTNRRNNNYGGKKDVAAPGVDIIGPRGKGTDVACIGQYSCAQGNSSTTSIVGENKDHYIMPGTSTASPHVAGLASLVMTKWPSYSAAQVKRAIYDNVDYKVFEYGQKSTFYGMINVDRTLNSPKATPTPYAAFKKWKVTFNPQCLNNQPVWDSTAYIRVSYEKERNNGEKYITDEVFSKPFGEKKTFEITSPDIETLIKLSAWSGYGNRVSETSMTSLPNSAMRFIERGEKVMWNAKDLPSGEYVFNYQASQENSCTPFKWSVQTEVVCKNGGIINTSDETQMQYMVWPPGNQEWQTLQPSKIRKQPVIITVNPPFSKIYVAIRTKDNTYLQPNPKIVRDKESHTVYSEYIKPANFGSNSKFPVLEWYANTSVQTRPRIFTTDGFVEKLYFQYYAPEAWCK